MSLKDARTIPSEGEEMICSEYASVSLIVTANIFADKLKEALDSKGVDTSTLKSPLARFPFPPKTDLSAVHPPYLIEIFGPPDGNVLQPVEPPDQLSKFVAFPGPRV